MSELFTIRLPKLGESIHSATIVQWLKQAGDAIALDEAILEVSTDKVNSEIPSPVAGVIAEILVETGVEVEVGAALATIKVGATAKVDEPSTEFVSPAVMNLLRKENIPLSVLETIQGTGEGGRVTKRDIEDYLKKAPPLSSDATHSRVQLSPLRKQIAENMMRAYSEIPHAALMTDVDVTGLLAHIASHKESFAKAHGAKLTMTPFIVKALAAAVVDFPLLNASIEGDHMLVKHTVNVGIAVGVEGGVMVPVCPHVERKSLEEIAVDLSALAEKARTGTIGAADVKGGTITLTNFGMTGIRSGLPIIRYPECAILGVGAIVDRVVAYKGEIVIRKIAEFTLSFDHRLLDGLYGCGFLAKVRDVLQEWNA